MSNHTATTTKKTPTSTSSPAVQVWSFGERPSESDPLATPETSALLVLNSPASLPCNSEIQRIWSRCGTHICADGGAHHLLTRFPLNSSRLLDGSRVSGPTTPLEGVSTISLIPNYIIGDFDSIPPETVRLYQAHGSQILCNPDDQDTTDFQKCLAFLSTVSVPAPSPPDYKGVQSEQQQQKEEVSCAPSRIRRIYVLGGVGLDRLDQTFATFSAMTPYAATHPDQKSTPHHPPGIAISIHTNQSISFVCGPGRRHVIELDRRVDGPALGIIPLYGPARIQTSGLQWNLSPDVVCEFGRFISTSNTWVDERIHLETDVPVLWTCQHHQLEEFLDTSHIPIPRDVSQKQDGKEIYYNYSSST